MLIAKLWGGITDDQFDLLKEHLETKKYKKNEIIYKNEGTPRICTMSHSGKSEDIQRRYRWQEPDYPCYQTD